MKLSKVLAVLLSASIPTGAFAQTFSGRSAAASSYGSPAIGAIQPVPFSFAAMAPLSLSAPSIAPGLTLVPGITPSALPSAIRAAASAAPAAAVPILPAALAAAVRPAASAPLTSASVQISKMAGEVEAFFKAAEPADKASSESSRDTAAKVFGALTEGPAAAGGTPVEAPAPGPNGNLTQQKMSRTLYQVAAIFAEQYAPIDWKKERFAVDLKREYDKAQTAILADPKITTRQFQDLLTAFVAAMRDYHVSISYNSTESARLPFLVAGAEGKHFLAYIDREKLPLKIFPFRVGDEIVAFDGKPTSEAVNEIASKLGGNTSETDQRLAELFLTNRRRGRGDTNIPDGNAVLGIRGRDGKLYKVRMPWDYTPELIPQDVPVRDSGLLEPQAPRTQSWEEDASLEPKAPRIESWADDALIAPKLPADGLKSLLGRAFANAIHPLARLFADMRSEAAANPFMMGARKSFVPRLGTVLWETKEDDAFHAYIFKAPDGRKVGFIRIPSYEGGAAEVARFAQIMAKFQKETSALVIDQVSNPGGAIFYLYALASHLTDKTLLTPRHRIIIGESDAQWAADLLLKVVRAQKVRAAATASTEDEEDDEWAGYPVTQKFMVLMVRFAQFILAQLEAGNRFTAPTHLWGVDDIDPAPKAEERYTKPILLLTNALDFSGGDFFPAIMQDNKRATIMGVRTSGAGGAVKPFSLPNQFGIEDLSATWTIAQRADGRPIENLGVTPDIAYDFTAKDLRTGFAEYRLNVLKALAGLIDGAKTTP
ncbi:MAG: protease-like activity factor CPAF [Elusimicrobia bacterium]|nr:protease-like activity factor CPAF [Elusimicrobiota bacterium]